MNLKELTKKGLPLIILALSLSLKLLATYAPGMLPFVFPLWIYRTLSQLFSTLLSLLPFSFTELILILIPLYCLYGLGKGIYLWIHKKSAHIFWRKVGKRVWVLSCVLISFFILTAGINYHRKPLSDYVGLDVQPLQKEELIQILDYLTDITNSAAENTGRNREGGYLAQHSFFTNSRLIQSAYDSLSLSYPFLKGRYPSVKPLVLSRWVSYTYIQGFFFPFTFEVNINNDIPHFMIPAVIAHEQAHLRGLMREEEAEYAVYLLARYASDNDLKYSFYLSTLIRSMNVLYRIDAESYHIILARFSDRLTKDINDFENYWRAFQSPMGKLSQRVNDAYLKANNQSDGVLSYGRVTELLIADYTLTQTLKNEQDEHH